MHLRSALPLLPGPRMDWRTVTFDWNHARAFLVAAEEGSFSAASRALATAQPTVGRQVAALEAELGVTLFERVGRSLVLTEAGVELADHVRAMGEAASRVHFAAAGTATSLEGVVAVTASEAIAAFLLPPVVAAIRAAHPGIELELVVSNDVRDLRRREADIAIRNVRPSDPDLVARLLHTSRARAYASPAYVARAGPFPAPADLARAAWFAFDRTDVMRDGLRALGVPVTAASFPLVTGNHLVQWALAREGLGIVMMMEEIGDAEPALVRVCPSLPPLPVPLWLTAHRELRTSRRVRAVYDLLADGILQRLGAGQPGASGPATAR